MDGKQAATPGKHGIKRETDKIHQPKYFQNPLGLKQKSNNIFQKWDLKDGEALLLLFAQEARSYEFIPG